jgi:hypothetical protein
MLAKFNRSAIEINAIENAVVCLLYHISPAEWQHEDHGENFVCHFDGSDLQRRIGGGTAELQKDPQKLSDERQ